MEGFNSFYNTILELMQKRELEEALVGGCKKKRS